MEIWVEPYYRLRFGRLELVRGHWRALPSDVTATTQRRLSVLQ